MGKSNRNNKARALRSDPIAKPVKPLSDPELAALREARILPVIKDLKSPEAKSRTAAARAIANIVHDTKCRKLLLREQVVHVVLTETLTDASPDSRAAGWEILKVLVQEEEADFCVHLYRLDILTAIEHAAKSIIKTLTATEQPFGKLLKAQQRLVWEITSSLIALLTPIALARDEILDAVVANPTILRFLFRLVASDLVPQEIFEETLSCLMVLSEDNLPLGQALTDDQETRCYDELLKFKTGGGVRAVLACGVLHNVFSSLQWLDHSPGKDGAYDAILVPSLSQELEQVSSSNGSLKTSNPEIAQVALEILASIGTDLQNTLEKGNRPQPGAAGKSKDEEWNGIGDEAADIDVDAVAEADDDDAMDVDGGHEKDDSDQDDKDEAGSDDDDDDDDLDEDMDLVTGGDDSVPDAAGLDDLPTLRELIQKALPQLIRLSSASADSDETVAIQIQALSALNNIAWTISMIDFAEGENAHVFDVWAPAAKKIWQKTITPILDSDNADITLATLVTSLAWAIARSLSGDTPSDGTQHRKFMALYQASKGLEHHDEGGDEGHCGCDCGDDDPLQSLGVKCIGVLGCLARAPASIDVNREIGVAFMSRLANTNDVAPPAEIIEMLNQLFDMYADEEQAYDKEVFWKDNFLQHLQELLPRLKIIAKGVDKRAFEELRTKADEAVLNLARFIQYKKKHAPR
ncbi:hypothetical protein B0T26DRAFT_850654 [Lasiosphaeria miniovina]|uniref:SYO1-like TPR repeats domain-containing protein n=1 Tax=Lasiosphaeria miniovina TaxID=1954250 RepID=A0AA40DZE2_9PEZI|nr:uncharacterized protein B0T26DRAFT_850654 [Lasiosphaeria miniovina]KAK0722179.1 hypothetical protein B0T26DRAFT_850654 [Lasiosphaeria miniovina]